jgi:hypothetical protein
MEPPFRFVISVSRSRGNHDQPERQGSTTQRQRGPGSRRASCRRRFTASSRRLGSQQLLADSRSVNFALRAKPPEVLARPEGFPLRDWTPLADGENRRTANDAGASFARTSGIRFRRDRRRRSSQWGRVSSRTPSLYRLPRLPYSRSPPSPRATTPPLPLPHDTTNLSHSYFLTAQPI